MVAPGVRQPDLVVDRPGERGAEPGAWSAAWRTLGILRRADGYWHPARNRDPALHTHDSIVDGPGGCRAARLERRASLLHHHHYHLAHRLDRAGAGRTRAFSLAARGRIRHGRAALWMQQAAGHLSTYGPVLFESHHRRDHPGLTGDDHQRDDAQLPGSGTTT